METSAASVVIALEILITHILFVKSGESVSIARNTVHKFHPFFMNARWQYDQSYATANVVKT